MALGVLERGVSCGGQAREASLYVSRITEESSRSILPRGGHHDWGITIGLLPGDCQGTMLVPGLLPGGASSLRPFAGATDRLVISLTRQPDGLQRTTLLAIRCRWSGPAPFARATGRHPRLFTGVSYIARWLWKPVGSFTV